MAVNVPDHPVTSTLAPPVAARSARRPFRDNPVLILVSIALLLAALLAMVGLADRSAQLSPDFLSEVVLYALTIADLTMLAALCVMLARNMVKLVVERRRGLPFARFRSKLVALLLGMTLVPASLVLLVGSEVIRKSAERWFSAPVDQVLASAREVASGYYEERERAVTAQAGEIAGALSTANLAAGDLAGVDEAVRRDIAQRRAGLVEIYRVIEGEGPMQVQPVVQWVAPWLPGGYSGAAADRLAAQILSGSAERSVLEPLRDGGELVRAAALIRSSATARPSGVVIVSNYLESDLVRHARRIVSAYEGYQQLRVLKRPLEGVYLSFFLMVTLLILVSATWMGLYLAKRITRPIQALSAGAREIGAGHLDHRIEPETRDEFGTVVEAFNTMAGELAASRLRLERSRLDLERKNLQIEGRRRYIEAILERIATGVISLGPDGRIGTVNGAASRLLQLGTEALGQPFETVLGRVDLLPLRDAIAQARDEKRRRAGALELALVNDGRELHLTVATTPLVGEDGQTGLAVVLDDVTPLIRAQKVAAWRDVARRLAHEVKNPLTPIQLCAERLRRHFSGAPLATRHLVDECSTTIVHEVESLKSLVDEFSQFARMPAPRTVPSDLHQLIDDALSLYRGLFEEIRIEPRFARTLPPVRVDPEQFRRVIINLVDNAIEALSGNGNGGPPGSGLVIVETAHDQVNSVARVVISDNGPGVSDADRARLFMPYYSTKGRGSGLGLAIVRRIIVEHGGSIEATDNTPHGTRMTIELPC
jgi:two-component system nitrogen regulation sensor histidine kinase NtrY